MTHPSTRSSRTPLVAAATLAVIALPLAPLTAVGPASASVAGDLRPPEISLWHDLDLATPGIGGAAYDLVTSAEGDVWYYDDSNLVRVDQNTHGLTTFPLPDRTWIRGMVGTSDGAFWYADDTSRTVNRLDPLSGTTVSFPLTGLRGAPATLVEAIDGSIWFGDPSAERLVRVDATGTLSSYPEPTGSFVLDMVAAPDGRLWYTRTGTDRVGVVDPVTGTFDDLGVDDSAGAAIVVGTSGSLWVNGDNQFTEIALDGTITAHPLTAPGSGDILPIDLAGGDRAGDADSEVYFVSSAYGFGTLDASGAVHFGRMSGFATDVEVDGRGHVWVNDYTTNKLRWN
ncbi:hypothetical protein SCB71_03075 [Herbiconiux sp. KACC 21604]|uniref:Vgb family protein n=1 Tax=unclassified Herbiconiux TaxID=2618217 RepID=UPI001490AD3C|nr:hypothetical protein [Herbiconiux sp. SALV-R1]QJU52379.1 hypothetical protein HL652_01045 [Herbiconiux sp. SALV-R1]WPO87238.1 hypothetical protein SCB71_03075 [Herbiconiux sp. KACC 21604]